MICSCRPSHPPVTGSLVLLHGVGSDNLLTLHEGPKVTTRMRYLPGITVPLVVTHPDPVDRVHAIVELGLAQALRREKALVSLSDSPVGDDTRAAILTSGIPLTTALCYIPAQKAVATSKSGKEAFWKLASLGVLFRGVSGSSPEAPGGTLTRPALEKELDQVQSKYEGSSVEVKSAVGALREFMCTALGFSSPSVQTISLFPRQQYTLVLDASDPTTAHGLLKQAQATSPSTTPVVTSGSELRRCDACLSNGPSTAELCSHLAFPRYLF
eukprot:NODE_5157_length_976_cov_102.733880_g4947_i0.p1 GENE.NODE_5157_length_976_cov_102.733880_g4947_i0~~NODE_5157_length_976_cov_102.733880_g4947_i0.p1  ORF type:complete len:270 (-),score=8.51 NODE_5157_length_976_cov_102.733880_g4947_i0:105-914(-)